MDARTGSRLKNDLIGTAVGAYAFLDDLILGPLLVLLAAWMPWWVILPLSWAFFTAVNLACCEWLQRRWEHWILGHGARVEALLERRRRSRLLRHPLGWLARDSDAWFTAAAGLIGTVIVVALARLSGAATLTRRRLVLGSAAYSFGFAATYTGVGVSIGAILRLL